MRAEFIAEVPQEANQRGRYAKYLRKLYSGEEKCVVFTLDSQKELKSAYNSIRYNLVRHKDAGKFSILTDNAANKLYVYKSLN